MVFQKGNRLWALRGEVWNKGKKLPPFTEQHRKKIAISRVGKRLSAATRLKLSQNLKGVINLGEKNGMWKGDKVKNTGLHFWVRTNKPKPLLCEECHVNRAYDAANVTGVYNRDFINWRFLCRRCHMAFDYKTGVRKRGG